MFLSTPLCSPPPPPYMLKLFIQMRPQNIDFIACNTTKIAFDLNVESCSYSCIRSGVHYIRWPESPATGAATCTMTECAIGVPILPHEFNNKKEFAKLRGFIHHFFFGVHFPTFDSLNHKINFYCMSSLCPLPN